MALPSVAGTAGKGLHCHMALGSDRGQRRLKTGDARIGARASVRALFQLCLERLACLVQGCARCGNIRQRIQQAEVMDHAVVPGRDDADSGGVQLACVGVALVWDGSE